MRHLLWKDLRTELRGKEGLQAGIVLIALFGLVALFLFEDLARRPAAAAAMLWFPLLYATVAALGRGFAREADQGTLALMLLAPVPAASHGVSRTLVNLLLAWTMMGITLAVVALVFAVPVGWSLVAVLALCAFGLTVPTTLAAALAAQSRAREVLLPVLVVPVVAPLIQAGAQATLTLLVGGGWADIEAALLIIVGYAMVASGVAWLLWPHVLEDA